MTEPVEKLFSSLHGELAWNVRIGHGSFLIIEFGNPTIERKEPDKTRRNRLITLRGEWHLWIYCCCWEIFDNGLALSNHEASRSRKAEGAKFLEGQILVNAIFTHADQTTRFLFDLGGELRTWPYPSDPLDQWMLYHDENVFTLRGDGLLELAKTEPEPNVHK